MSFPKRIVVDANILIRGVLGARVRTLLNDFDSQIIFCAPEVCLEDARKYIPLIARQRDMNAAVGLATLDQLLRIVQVVDRNSSRAYETTARRRIASRDVDDWPILATSLLLDCPIWTEDRDFFGCGVATWTTDNVAIYLNEA